LRLTPRHAISLEECVESPSLTAKMQASTPAEKTLRMLCKYLRLVPGRGLELEEFPKATSCARELAVPIAIGRPLAPSL
jgi:hypothetical protein